MISITSLVKNPRSVRRVVHRIHRQFYSNSAVNTIKFIIYENVQFFELTANSYIGIVACPDRLFKCASVVMI